MNRFLLLIPSLLLTAAAQALPADRFQCEMTLERPPTGESTTQIQDFFIARLPAKPGADPSIQMTVGTTSVQMKQTTPQIITMAKATLYYKHAVRLDAQGNPVDARQLTCLNLSIDSCKAQRAGECGTLETTCVESPNPFDPVNGWRKVGLANNTPILVDDYMSISGNFTDNEDVTNAVLSYKIKCSYKGTYL